MNSKTFLGSLFAKFGSDKSTVHSYDVIYEEIFNKIKNSELKILEIGCLYGASLKAWKEYFPNSVIYGIDINHCNIGEERIIFNQIDGTNKEMLEKSFGDIKFDIIIDDGSHNLHDQKKTYEILLDFLNENGYYCIEDVQNYNEAAFDPLFRYWIKFDSRSFNGRYDDIIFMKRLFDLDSEKEYLKLCKDNLEYEFAKRSKNGYSDISEHLITLSQYASECDVVVEFGMRSGNSTWGLLHGRPKELYSYDVIKCFTKDLESASNEVGINFKFQIGDSRLVDFPKCDLLFIDSYHSFDHLLSELKRSELVGKYIIIHDTTTFGFRDQDQIKDAGTNVGLVPAIDFFLSNFVDGKNWFIEKKYENCNGLTILKRK